MEAECRIITGLALLFNFGDIMKLLPFKIESMTSLEIAELTGKAHKHVLRDIRSIVEQLEDSPNLGSDFKSSNYVANNGKEEKCFHLNKIASLVLVTGYSAVFRVIIIARWQFLEEQLETLKFKLGDKKHQLDAMEALSHLLPDDLAGEELSYIKANTVVNKVTSNLFGFPKMLKKADMSPDMLEMREKILDDYIKLYEVMESNSEVSEYLYEKWQPKRLEAQQA